MAAWGAECGPHGVEAEPNRWPPPTIPFAPTTRLRSQRIDLAMHAASFAAKLRDRSSRLGWLLEPEAQGPRNVSVREPFPTLKYLG